MIDCSLVVMRLIGAPDHSKKFNGQPTETEGLDHYTTDTVKIS